MGRVPWASPSRTAKSTTPTPSLKRDSPVILISSPFGACADLRIPMTAIGSVGEISAPKTKQSRRRMGSPTRSSTIHAARPTIVVEISTPTVARTPMACRRLSRSAKGW
jgi:hypothetical protein